MILLFAQKYPKHSWGEPQHPPYRSRTHPYVAFHPEQVWLSQTQLHPLCTRYTERVTPKDFSSVKTAVMDDLKFGFVWILGLCPWTPTQKRFVYADKWYLVAICRDGVCSIRIMFRKRNRQPHL